MKKKMIALLAGALMMMASSSAFAAYADLNLIRVVYNKSANLEVAADLLSFDGTAWKTAAGTPTNQVVGGGNQAFSLTKLGATSFGELNVAYFAKTGTSSTTANFWMSHDNPTSAKVDSGAKAVMFISAGNNIYSMHGALDYSAGSTGHPKSYWVNMNSNNPVSAGSFRGILNAGLGEVNLADLATKGYVDQYLYFFETPNTLNSAGVKVATIRTMVDGSSVINPGTPSNVPVPPALFLMGSGLLGLVGIRRKKQ